LVLLLCSNKSTLQADDAIVKTYISKQIKPGDTLWDIADSNKLSYMDTAEYVTEIQKINNLKNSTLIAGEYIILPIYTSSASNV
jgi:LysM repeat protein